MKDEFIAGFVKAAVDKGLDDETIARIFKRAMANPQVGGMFHNMPQSQQPMQPNNLQALSQMKQSLQQNPQNLQILKQLLAQTQPPVQ